MLTTVHKGACYHSMIVQNFQDDLGSPIAGTESIQCMPMVNNGQTEIFSSGISLLTMFCGLQHGHLVKLV